MFFCVGSLLFALCLLFLAPPAPTPASIPTPLGSVRSVHIETRKPSLEVLHSLLSTKAKKKLRKKLQRSLAQKKQNRMSKSRCHVKSMLVALLSHVAFALLEFCSLLFLFLVEMFHWLKFLD